MRGSAWQRQDRGGRASGEVEGPESAGLLRVSTLCHAVTRCHTPGHRLCHTLCHMLCHMLCHKLCHMLCHTLGHTLGHMLCHTLGHTLRTRVRMVNL